MRLLSPRLLVPLAALVIAWGGVHIVTARQVSVAPAAWPFAAPSPAAAPAPQLPLSGPSPAASPGAGDPGGVPFLPGALQQLNGSTRDTAVGLYALIQQLEAALEGHLDALIRQVEPGR